MLLKCQVCKSDSYTFAQGILLDKYEVDYFQCSNCGFIQTEEPYWLEEAYSDVIAKTDVGLVFRNNNLSRQAAHIIFHLFNHDARFLDYGGGYGLFVRMMRDLGFDFYWSDKFCTNLFAKGFELDEAASDSYELVTAFEVFEHFVNPSEEIENIFKFSRNILLSTELLPENNPKPNEWWYYAPHHGQHISIYTLQTLSVIADKYDLNLYSNGSSLHLLTEKKLLPDLFNTLCQSQPEALNKKSLLQSDYSKAVISLMNSNHHNLKNVPEEVTHSSKKYPKILVDGVFFQLYKTGIARVWKSLLKEWVNNGFAKHIVVLDRAGTAPKIPDIRYRLLPAYDYNNTDVDREILQQVCDEEAADLFISSYYTTPTTTPSVFMAYDMIPEVMGWDINNLMWQVKHQAIQNASGYLAISENTARDLVRFFPEIPLESVKVALCGVTDNFSPASQQEVNIFKIKYGISKPYFIIVSIGGYKNTILFLEAFARLDNKQAFDIVCTGGSLLDEQLRRYTSGSTVHMLQLSDEELKTAYSGAIALIYPSKYEGFGLPVLEAIACGCPVITCPNASIPEVAGKAALYVQDDDIEEMANALCEIQKPSVRKSLIAAGLEQAKKFSWSDMAKVVSSTLIDTTLEPLNLKEINLIVFPDWLQPEELLGLELQRVISAIATHPASDRITLLIDTTDISPDDAELLLSGVAMNLLMEEDLDITEGVEISLVVNLADIQWQVLLSHIQARIILSAENQQAIALYGANIPAFKLENLITQQTEQFFLNRSNGLETFDKQVREMKDKQFNNSLLYNIKEIPISLPDDHALPHYQKKFRLYDKFLGVIAKHLPNNQDFLVDIGANVGDTTALMMQYCLNPIICIEADEDFFCLLKDNLSEYKQRIIFVNSFVSGSDLKNVELVKNKGTARAVETKNKIVKSDSLESIIKNSNLGKCILIKTDTDGFDFEILLSSLSIIKEDSPILYWENEISSLKDLEMAKNLLKKLGDMNYSKYMILDNFGNPLIYEGSSQLVEQINEYLLNNRYTQNSTFYYTDIAAFPDRYSHLILEIASDYNNFIRSSNLYP